MLRCILVILVGVASSLEPTRTSAQAGDLSFVSIALPQDIPSETVQISYYLVGPFGGFGGYAAQQFGVTSYQIPTAIEGQAATEIRAIVYAPGCEMQELVIPLAGQSQVSYEFACQRVEPIRLSGQIVPSELARYANVELVISYRAWWAHRFFGIADGPVTKFELARMSTNADGSFDVVLPMISGEPTRAEPQGTVCLMLRDSRTLNHIARNLEPDDAALKSDDRCLQAQAFYPIGMSFTAQDFEKSTLKGKVFRSDSGESVSNSYILLSNETDQEKHFDTRTDEAGNYIFGHVPTGRYTVSIYAWFEKRDEIPCQNPQKQKTVDGGEIMVEWQEKSKAFVEIVTIKGFSIESEAENVKYFDITGN